MLLWAHLQLRTRRVGRCALPALRPRASWRAGHSRMTAKKKGHLTRGPSALTAEDSEGRKRGRRAMPARGPSPGTSLASSEAAGMTANRPSLLLGAHVSAAGGVPEAPIRAGELKASAMQFFTKNGNRW